MYRYYPGPLSFEIGVILKEIRSASVEIKIGESTSNNHYRLREDFDHDFQDKRDTKIKVAQNSKNFRP